MFDFPAAIESREKSVADIEQGHISTTACILSNMAQTLGRTRPWDPTSGKILSGEEANRLLRRPYRKPWVHPEVET